MKKFLFIGFITFIAVLSVSGQIPGSKKLIQATGFITDDENKPVYNAAIVSKKLNRGTISEFSGIYSIISIPGDTITVSALGYKKYLFSIPVDFEGQIFKKDISLVSDTISIEGITILPWRNYEEFKREFLSTVPALKPELRYMYQNLAYIQRTIENSEGKSTPEAGYRMAMQQTADGIITRNQSPANNLLNPFAWAKFFSGVKNGLLKNEKSGQKSKNKTKVSSND
ncbi:MAG: carboxypeptidase-like regulatory domain-containing protein [Bacteroidales bacterium]|nr:carboxypeptidase-like regulatory domain-containing protein [Bacteroidales bacterium]